MKAKNCFFVAALMLCASQAFGNDTEELNSAPKRPGFIENKGQVVDQDGKPVPHIAYLLQTEVMIVQIGRDGFSYTLLGDAPIETEGSKAVQYERVDFRWTDADAARRFIVGKANDELSNYVTPSGFYTAVRSYQEVRLVGVQEGIDVVFRLTEDGAFKYDVVARRGADLGQFRMSVGTKQPFEVLPDGLLFTTLIGALRESIPLATLHDGDEVSSIDASFVPIGRATLSFAVEGCAHRVGVDSVVIDPLPIVRRTNFGGAQSDVGKSIISKSGSIYVLGVTQSSNLASTGAYVGSFTNPESVFCTKLSADLVQNIWTTYLYDNSGSSTVKDGLGVDNSGGVHITITTTCIGLPTTNGTSSIGGSAYQICLAANGQSLTWSTYLTSCEANGTVSAQASATDGAGNTYVVCNILSTTCRDLTIGTVSNPSSLKFALIKLTPTGSFSWATYLYGMEYATDVALNADATLASVVGSTLSIGLSTSNALQYSAGADGFVTIYSSSGTLSSSTYFPGNGVDELSASAFDPTGVLYITGWSNSTDLVNVNNLPNAVVEAIVARLNPATGYSPAWSTYLNDIIGNAEKGFDVCVGGTSVFTMGNDQSSVNFLSAHSFSGVLQCSEYYGNFKYWQGSLHTANSVALVGQGSGGPGFTTTGVYGPFPFGGLDAVVGIHSLSCPPDCLGVLGGTTLPGTACDDENPLTLFSVWNANCVCVAADCLELVVQLDNNPAQSTWSITGGGETRSGGPYSAVQANTTVVEPILLPTGALPTGSCYDLNVTDQGGMCCGSGFGGYLLRMCDGRAVIDNRNGAGTGDGIFSTGVSSTICAQDFCLPLGQTQMVVGSCNVGGQILWRVPGFCTAAASVPLQADPNAGWVGADDNRGYRFQFFDPDGAAASQGQTISNNAQCTTNGNSTNAYCRNIPHLLGYGTTFPPLTNQTGADRYSFVDPSFWNTNRPPRNVWLNVRVQRVTLNGAGTGVDQFEPYGPACRVRFVTPPANQPRTVAPSTGEFEVALSRVTVWPNPNDGLMLNISLWDLGPETSTGELSIFRTDGSLVASRAFATGSARDVLLEESLSNYQPGHYLLRISHGSEVFIRPFIVLPR